MKLKIRFGLLMLIDIVLVNIAYAGAYFLRFHETGEFIKYYSEALLLLAVATLVHLAAFYLGKLYHRVWAYASTGELLAVIYAVTAGSLGVIGFSFFFREQLPRSVLIIAWTLVIILIGGSRFYWRIHVQGLRGLSSRSTGRNALIVGAGDAGLLPGS